MTVSERIKARRKELNLSLEEVGKRMGVHKSTIKRYEDGVINAENMVVLRQLAEILLTTPEYLLGFSENQLSGDGIKKLNPQIAVIARASEKMTDEQIIKLRKMAEMLFPEAFK